MNLVKPLGNRRGLLASAALAGALFAASPVSVPGRVRLENGELRLAAGRFVIRGVAYYGAPGDERPRALMPAAPCLYARDLPLIATMGANVVRTYGLLPEGDRTFLPMLESTGMHWLAGFPLDPFLDRSRPLNEQKPAILDGFRRYALRFRGQTHTLAYVFEPEAVALLPEAAAILREIEPGGGPLLTAVAASTADLARRPSGLSFWSWNAGQATGGELAEAVRSAALPILITEFNAGEGDADALAAAVSRAAAEIESTKGVLGAVYPNYAGDPRALFESSATRDPALDSLKPRPVYYALASRWGGRYPAAWQESAGPQLTALEDGSLTTSPGALVRIGGNALLHDGAPYSDEAWPFELGTVCVCVGGAPARLNYVSRTEIGAQIPSELEAGERTAILFRAGAASNPLTMDIRQFTAGASTGPVLEARLRY